MDFSNYGSEFENWQVPAIENLFGNDCQLRSYEKDIRRRYGMFEKMKNLIESREGMDRFTQGYKDYGVIVTPDGGIRCQEWAPNAKALYLQGEFNNFQRMAFKSIGSDRWELGIPPASNGSCPIRHLSELKLVIETQDNRTFERISPWARYVVPRKSDQSYQWLFWNPSHQHSYPKMSHPRCDRLRIYEAHVGMAATQHCEISSYQNFTSNLLPRIHEMGYNCVLLMALMEQSQHQSSGYGTPTFFSTSSRYGTPEDLRDLIRTAHNMGMVVMMDVMYNQSLNSMRDGVGMFNGNDGYSFYGRRRDCCSNYNSRNFDFTKWDVLRFLMSNLRYYLEEFCFDGFRFNGVTSMLYQDRSFGPGYNFSDDDYFGVKMDFQSMVYFMLVNDMIHRYYPNAITIAEDYSDVPALCRPICEGGFGFDYRSAISAADVWQKFLTEKRDEDWDLDFLFRSLTKRRKGEKYIAFTEKHDQNLFGRRTIGRFLMHRDNMYETSPRTTAYDRGLSLHKMIRLITHAFVGESYMNFMGNEFGHPDWVEFPSTTYSNNMYQSRRLFQLVDDDNLRYKYLSRFDAAMNKAEEKYGWLRAGPAFVSRKHDGDKVFVFERAGLLFLFNFHPTHSYSNYHVGVEHAGKYEIVLDTDSKYYGGYGRNQSRAFHTLSSGFDSRPKSLTVYLPSRSAIVMANHDFLSPGCYEDSMSSRGVCQPYYGSSYGRHPIAPTKYTDASHSYSSSYDGGDKIVEENHHKRVSFRNRESSRDRHDRCYDYVGGNPCDQHYSKNSEYQKCCDYKKEEYGSAKYSSGGYQRGRYW